MRAKLASSLISIVSLISATCCVIAATTENNSCTSESGPAPYDVTAEQIETFQRDGVVVIRSLLQGKELEDAIQAAETLNRKKSLARRLLKLFSTNGDLEFQTWRKFPALEKVAFESAAPTISAKLMGLDGVQLQHDGDGKGETQTEVRPMRLLKDAMLSYKPGDVKCGWHVDDKFFWPAEDKKIGDRDAGVNVWITLSHVSVEGGGGLAVAPGTHTAPFAEKAREVIKGAFKTCAMREVAPDIHDQMEEIKATYDLQPGDALFLNRYVFHRGDAFSDHEHGDKEGTKRRITLRYVPADATYEQLNSQANIKSDNRVLEKKGIVTGDPMSVGGEYFPQVWPNSLPEERRVKALPDKDSLTLINVLKMIIAMRRRK